LRDDCHFLSPCFSVINKIDQLSTPKAFSHVFLLSRNRQ
jgi:hypothetical protein